MLGLPSVRISHDFIAFFDCLHDMPDPVGALRAVRAALADGGIVMLVEPMAWDTVAEGLNPLGKVFAAASVYVCLSSGLSGPPQAWLGNQAGPAPTCALAREAGFGAAGWRPRPLQPDRRAEALTVRVRARGGGRSGRRGSPVR
ncbi:hypothetical protein LWC35_18020 [Pseudonocardia kujensis]|uniref:hypothetical protein n=1 Tax=Pseudonocardia kujensis TaxID=1128675 RepID=UPI001E558D28|nr:hypothetical protein [Pseudonocardia kujensis]MCE0764790.1 hypothetical protein [Pseudonocardia kujensis]